MASGDPILDVLQIIPPDADAALPDVLAGGSTPAEQYPVWNFADGASLVYLDFLCRVSEKYAGGGITLTLPWVTTATTGDAVLGAAFRRLNTAEDLDTSHAYSAQETTTSAPATASFPVYPTIAFADGAQIDSVAAGELCIVRVYRDPTDGSDDLAATLQLLGLSGKET